MSIHLHADRPHPPLFARTAGTLLRFGFRLILLVRRPRPIHPKGMLLEGRIRWTDADHASGIGWIDSPPPRRETDVVARLSRSVGLPDGLPDIIGLALRVNDGGTGADIEFASTGAGVPLRFALLPHRLPSRARFGTLFPYRGEHGPVLLSARTLTPPLPSGGEELDRALADSDWRLALYWATPLGRWRAFASVSLRRAADQEDRGLRFDAVRRPLPGSWTYPWVRAARQPSYELAQGPVTGATASTAL